MPVVDEEQQLRVLARLAPKIRDHKDLETKLTTAPPQLRSLIYEVLKPFLKFKPWPLDRYVASAGQMAERERLPLMDDKGNLREPLPNSLITERVLTLVCAKCTKQKDFYASFGETNVDVILKARKQGWVYDYLADPPTEICPTCPTSLRTFDA